MKSTLEKNNTVSIAASTYNTARRLAKAEGMKTQAWLEKLVRSNLEGTAEKRPIMFPVTTLNLLESNTAAVNRLAKQFNKDPEIFASEVLRAGLQALDDCSANNCQFDLDPPYLFAGAATYDVIHSCTINGILERMPEHEIADARKEATDSQRTLQEIVRDRYARGVNMERLQ